VKIVHSLQGQLWLACLGILVAAWGIVAWAVHGILVADVEAEAVQRTLREADAVSSVVQRMVPASVDAADDLLRPMATALNARITYIADNGTVLLDTLVPPEAVPRLENHATRPEIRDAQNHGLGIAVRYSDTVQQEMIYVARSVSAAGGLPQGFVRVAAPYATVAQIAVRAQRNVVVVFAGTVLVAVVGVNFLIRFLRRSIAALCRDMAAVGDAGGFVGMDEDTIAELAPLVRAFNAMGRRVESQIQTVAKQGRELEAVLNGMRAGVVVLDTNGRIVRGNPAARELFADLESFVGRQIMELTLEPTLQQACEEALAHRVRGENTALKVEAFMGGRILDVSLVPIPGDADIGVILLFHDITAIKRAEQVRRDFVANVSHELRTPLTSIKGYAETLLGLEGCAVEPAKGFLETILRNANHMHALIEDVLQLSRLEHGRMRPALGPIVLSGVVAAVCKGISVPEGVRLHVDLEGLPIVQGHWESLAQVFRNVLENALKYVPRPGGEIWVHGISESGSVVVHVDDNGPGIPPEDVERVFERFYRVEKDRSQTISGTGLGLAICRHIMHQLRGSIVAQSPVPGQTRGARFTITLPCPQT
jgi:two-component system phosphate regulon sensor histidine kinase PhoR